MAQYFFTPQMAPYNWLTLFSIFNMILIFYVSKNYYMPITPPTPSKHHLKKIIYKWKW